MALQKGQTVVLESRGARSHLNNEPGILLNKDATTGRYRVRLQKEPWKCVKVNRNVLKPALLSESQGLSGGHSCFNAAIATCDFTLGAYTKPKRQDIPQVELEDAVLSNTSMLKTWPPSPGKRGKMQSIERHRVLPCIPKGEFYRDIEREVPHQLEDSRNPHRLRQRTYSYFKDAEGSQERVVGLKPRKPPVRKGQPHALLPQETSEDLLAFVEEDHRDEFDRKLDQPRYLASFVPKTGVNAEYCEQKEEEMCLRLERIKEMSEATRNWVKESRQATQTLMKDQQWASIEEEEDDGMNSTPSSEHGHDDVFEQTLLPAMICEGEGEGQPTFAESEESRIAREFKEYEMESLSHTSTPAANQQFGNLFEGFEESHGFEESEFEDDQVDGLLGVREPAANGATTGEVARDGHPEG